MREIRGIRPWKSDQTRMITKNGGPATCPAAGNAAEPVTDSWDECRKLEITLIMTVAHW